MEVVSEEFPGCHYTTPISLHGGRVFHVFNMNVDHSYVVIILQKAGVHK